MLFSDQWFEYGLFLAVSGGADSSAMLHCAVRYARSVGLPDPIVGHVNHGLRGVESDGDELFVSLVSGEYGLRFFSHRITAAEWDADKTGSVEAAAREIRYNFLLRTASEVGCRYIATAHTADDQVETILHRLIRGTGIVGLSGISAARQLNHAVSIVRPMLEVNREWVLKYLDSIGKSYRVDSSNSGTDFMRNRIRNELLPMLRLSFNSDIDGAILRLSAIAGEVNDIVADWFELRAKEIIISATKNEIVINRTKLNQLSCGMICEFFRRIWEEQSWSLRYMGFERWNELAKFALQGTSSMQLTGSIVVTILNKKNLKQNNQSDQNDYLIIKRNP
ncbi:MAG: tRNA lysidine(34) synthetase TilS [Planctomycetaceae bacterium]|jgi:tRNA(Ile)-lysidine synthase|nr:tRNA lysidine(34) synthetase TilS [Planctomycetaceae bacterium]